MGLRSRFVTSISAFCKIGQVHKRWVEREMKMSNAKPAAPIRKIESSIRFIRGKKVLLDRDLASLYQVETKVLMQAVRRNIERFPGDFMFQLTPEEAEGSRSQIVTLKRGQNIKYLPHAFTEQGVAMLSSVLRSKQAVQVNIEIMRAFVYMNTLAYSHAELAFKLNALEKKYDAQFKVVFDAIRELMALPKPKKNRIGFHWDEGPAPAKKKVPSKKRAPAKS